jgi:hypothetical protein
MKKFNTFVKENYNMGKMDVITRIMELSDEYDQEELDMMADVDLDQLVNQLESEDKDETNIMPSGTGGFMDNNDTPSMSYTGSRGGSGVVYTGEMKKFDTFLIKEDLSQLIGYLGMMGILGIMWYGAHKIPELIRKFARNQQEAKELAFLYNRYNHLFEGDETLRSMIIRYKELDRKCDDELVEMKAKKDEDPFNKDRFGIRDNEAHIYDTPSFNERTDELTNIGKYVRDKIVEEFGEKEVAGSLDRKITTLRNALIKIVK